MSKHSYTRCWLHMIWGTLKREKLLPRDACKRVSEYLTDYAEEKKIYMKINYVNADHVHALIDLPTNLSIEEVFQLFKGSSSAWTNRNDLISGKFSWGRGIRRIFGIAFQYIRSCKIYRKSGRTSSQKDFCGGI